MDFRMFQLWNRFLLLLSYEIPFFGAAGITSDTHPCGGNMAISLFMDDSIWSCFFENLDDRKKYDSLYTHTITTCISTIENSKSYWKGFSIKKQ